MMYREVVPKDGTVIKCSPEAMDAAKSILLRARRGVLTDNVFALGRYLETLMRHRDRRLRNRRK